MKYSLLLLASSFVSSLFSQALTYEVRGTYKRPIKQEALHTPKLMSDLIPAYPVNWISSYRSAEISVNCHGKEQTSISNNDTLSPEQQEILRTAGLNAEVSISIHYTYQVPVTGVIEHNTMHVNMTVVPESEAQYHGGHQELLHYLKDHGPKQMPVGGGNGGQQALIRFTVDEEGNVADPKIIRSCGDEKTDLLFLELIQNMPSWKAAEHPKGTKVKQEFELIARKAGDGC